MKSNKTCHILIANGFVEKSVSQTLEILRTLDVESIILNQFVSPKMEARFADYIAPFQLISDLEESPLPNGLLFAGGEACARQFMIDPRVSRLAKQMLEANRPVGFLYPASTPLVTQLHSTFSGRALFVQEKTRIFQFLHNFSSHLHVPSTPFHTPPPVTSLLY